MATSDYRKAFDEAAGDKAKYYELTSGLPERHRSTAAILWTQFSREIETRVCICANGGELVRFLKHLPTAHEDFTIQLAVSAEVDGTVVKVESNPLTKTITITSAI